MPHIENNIWVCGNTIFILSVEHDISQVRNIMFNMRNISGIYFQAPMYFFCLLYTLRYRFSTNIKCPEAMIGDVKLS